MEKKWCGGVLCFLENSLCILIVALVELSLRENKWKTLIKTIDRPFSINKQFREQWLYAFCLRFVVTNKMQKLSEISLWMRHWYFFIMRHSLFSPVESGFKTRGCSWMRKITCFGLATWVVNLSTFERTCIFCDVCSSGNLSEISRRFKKILDRDSERDHRYRYAFGWSQT